MSPREKFMTLVSNDVLQKADAIVILEGDLLERNVEGARLYRERFAPLVVISGGDTSKRDYALPASEMLPDLLEKGVPREAVVLEEKSQNTREQAIEIMKLAKERGWKSILIVATHYHQYRAFLTFLKAMRDSGLSLILTSSPARPKWFGENGRGKKRIGILEDELRKIKEYGARGDVASFEEGIEYLQWKESLV